jgi:putative ABC transport system permease protein
VRASLARARLGATLMLVFGLVAVALAAVGAYGLMSYSVAQRMGELAVRSAIGASQREIVALVMRRGVRLAVAGIAAGVIGAVLLRQALASQLYGVTPLDLQVFAAAAIGLFGIAAIACLVPALRATRVQPADLLRSE